MRKSVLLIFFLLLSVCMRAELLSVHVQLLRAGMLAEELGVYKDSVMALKISGPINGTDIIVLRKMMGIDNEGNLIDCNLRILDLEDARIWEAKDYEATYATLTLQNHISRN